MTRSAIAFYKKVIDGNVSALKRYELIIDGKEETVSNPSYGDLVAQARQELRDEAANKPAGALGIKADAVADATDQGQPIGQPPQEPQMPATAKVKDQAEIECDILYQNAGLKK